MRKKKQTQKGGSSLLRLRLKGILWTHDWERWCHMETSGASWVGARTGFGRNHLRHPIPPCSTGQAPLLPFLNTWVPLSSIKTAFVSSVALESTEWLMEQKGGCKQIRWASLSPAKGSNSAPVRGLAFLSPSAGFPFWYLTVFFWHFLA